MKKRISSILQYIFFLGLGFALIWYSSKDLTPEQMKELKDSFSQTRFLYIIPVIIALMASHYSRALRWIILMQPLGYKPGRANTFLTVMIGYFFNLLVPRLGEVMKCTLLGKYEKIPPDKLIGTIVAERAFDLVCLVLISFIMLATQFSLLGEPFFGLFDSTTGEEKAGPSWLRILIIISAAIVAFLIVRWLFRRFAATAIIKRIKAFGYGIWQGLTSIRYINARGAFIFHTVFIWLMYLTSIWLGFRAFPAVAHLGMDAAISVLVFGSLGMIATQGGIGAYQWAVQKTLLLYSIPAVAGLAFGWVIWGAQTAFILVGGILCLLILPFLNRKKHA